MSGEQTARLSNDEEVARCVIFPNSLPKVHDDGSYDRTAGLLYLKKLKTNLYAFSVGARSELPSSADVHDYGCRTAANGNTVRAAEAAAKDKPTPPKLHYLGFYELGVADASAASNIAYLVYVEPCEENGEKAHCHLTLSEVPGLDQNTPKSVYRTKVVDHLWRSLRGPDRHTCDCDASVKEELDDIELPARP